jgi:hypothetical protein
MESGEKWAFLLVLLQICVILYLDSEQQAQKGI